MEIDALASMAVAASQAKTQESLKVMMIKQANDAQKQLAGMLEALSKQQQPDPRYNMSVFG